MMRFTLPLALVLAAGVAHAEDTPEDRLRNALRQSVQEMRAAQDQAAQAQAQLAQAQADLASTKSQLDAANAKLAAFQGKGAAKPEEVRALQGQLAQAQAQNTALQQGLGRYQGAIQQAQSFARDRERESRQAAAGLAANTRALETCKTANQKLIAVSEQVLHLYESQSFRSILLRSYEPIIGAWKVNLQNIVQDYDDKIRDQEYVPPPAPPARR